VADDELERRIRDLVSRALDEDGFVLALPGALQAVAEHARLRAMDEDTFVELARSAYQAVTQAQSAAAELEPDAR
jgi:hypothetical protein